MSYMHNTITQTNKIMKSLTVNERKPQKKKESQIFVMRKSTKKKKKRKYK